MPRSRCASSRLFLALLRAPAMDTCVSKEKHGGSQSGDGGGGIGIAPSNHVYGPASIHLLPCKIHHTGPAPVATYFRPSSAAAVSVASGVASDDSSAEIARSRGNGDVMAEVVVDRGEKKELSVGGSSNCSSMDEKRMSDGVVKKARAVAGALGTRDDGQVCEHFEDDAQMQTARFRGRRLL